MEDGRVGGVIRALRLRKAWRQRDLALAAGLNQSDVSEMERGHVASYRVERVRRVFAALDARCDLEPRWRGAALDRLLDERHARLAGQAGELLGAYGWAVLPEVTYSEYGERGSIDLLAAWASVRAVCVIEIKSEFVSAEATLRSMDVKTRLAPKLCRERFGSRHSSSLASSCYPTTRRAGGAWHSTPACLNAPFRCAAGKVVAG